ncbi:hypothetical protein AVEN_264029-1 [Araneus ventricosus]|uniref:Uncharacterized protein n=1 Tax=Araneus ventricosus TaxID=182803 RepID=A0A4Y2RQ21_ARAVE|nr:hypothetical protein AVEN_264029-1 [Araneus ventricosus]
MAEHLTPELRPVIRMRELYPQTITIPTIEKCCPSCGRHKDRIIHHYQTGGHEGHDGNLFNDAASVLDNFFG